MGLLYFHSLTNERDMIIIIIVEAKKADEITDTLKSYHLSLFLIVKEQYV